MCNDNVLSDCGAVFDCYFNIKECFNVLIQSWEMKQTSMFFFKFQDWNDDHTYMAMAMFCPVYYLSRIFDGVCKVYLFSDQGINTR